MNFRLAGTADASGMTNMRPPDPGLPPPDPDPVYPPFDPEPDEPEPNVDVPPDPVPAYRMSVGW
jgi:hypothetical protein